MERRMIECKGRRNDGENEIEEYRGMKKEERGASEEKVDRRIDPRH